MSKFVEKLFLIVLQSAIRFLWTKLMLLRVKFTARSFASLMTKPSDENGQPWWIMVSSAWQPRLYTIRQLEIWRKVTSGKCFSYSPDLAPSDCFLFPQMKEYLSGTRFSSDDEIKIAAKKWINEQGPHFYEVGISRSLLMPQSIWRLREKLMRWHTFASLLWALQPFFKGEEGINRLITQILMLKIYTQFQFQTILTNFLIKELRTMH